LARIEFEKLNDYIEGEIVLPFSKSITNRAYLIKKISNQHFNIINPSFSSDSENLRANIKLLDNCLVFDKPQIIDIGDAGTNMRFLTALLSITHGIWILSGSERMKQRPIKELVDTLISLGADIKYVEKNGFPPLLIKGKKIEGGEILVDSEISSQFISALLLIAPVLKNGLKIKFSGKKVSYSYIMMTLKVLQHFGIIYHEGGDYIFVDEQNFIKKDIEIEADWSSASYWYEVAALSKKSNIKLKGLKKLNLQGDEIVAEIFEMFGVSTFYDNESITLKKNGKVTKNISLNCCNFPDLVPAIAFTAAGLGISTKLTGVGHLIHKESNRIEAIANEINKLGVECYFDSDKIILASTKINFEKEVIFKTYNDHRLAMSLAPLALKTGTINIDNCDVVAKSYPHFWNDLIKVGFKVRFS